MIDSKIFYIDKKLYHETFPPDESPQGKIERIASVNRINALACIMAARHGWIGASFSCGEILSYIYNLLMNTGSEKKGGDILILSKGHAAPMQYACLAAAGKIPFESLLTYKTKDGLQAHSDLKTPGVACNTGSLGQSLSKSCGLALAGKRKGLKRKIFVVIGDGEFQEGQNYEALMSLKKFNLKNVIPVIDNNGLQTDSPVKAIKNTGDTEKILRGFGFNPVFVRGHREKSLQEAFGKVQNSGSGIVIADTIKGYGSKITAMPSDARPGTAMWHSKIPSREEYLKILRELVSKTESRPVLREFSEFKNNFPRSRNSKGTAQKKSTRDVFAEKIIEAGSVYPDLAVLDADLSKSLKLNFFAEKFPGRFFQMGIAEQDMVSVAGGMALEGLVPVVNTYGAFFRRAFEQVYVNATEKTFVIYAGNYSGLCYSTDGKTHQMTGDVPMMKTIPDMRVYDPFCARELEYLLDYLLSGRDTIKYPVYIRLRRTPPDFPVSLPETYSFSHNRGVELKKGENICLAAAGPHMCAYALEAARRREGGEIGVAAFTPQNFLDRKHTLNILKSYSKIITLEESVTSGGLGDELSGILSPEAKVIKKGVSGFTFSCRDKDKLFKNFNLDTGSILKSIEEIDNS